jgi:hypothetical protein
MNIRNKNASFLDGLTVFYDTFGKSFFSSKMKLTAFALSFFSIITFHIEARSQQVPAKAKVAVVKHSVTKGKAKTKKTKKVVVVKKDTILDIDPANVNSPLYNKN